MRHGRIYLYPVGDGGWSPFTLGTFADLKEAGIAPIEGLKLRFYNDDADDEGNPDDLLFEGIAHFRPERGWGAALDEGSFHSVSDENRKRGSKS